MLTSLSCSLKKQTTLSILLAIVGSDNSSFFISFTNFFRTPSVISATVAHWHDLKNEFSDSEYANQVLCDLTKLPDGFQVSVNLHIQIAGRLRPAHRSLLWNSREDFHFLSGRFRSGLKIIQ